MFQFRHLQFTYLATTGRFELDRPLHPLRDLRERLRIPPTQGLSSEEHAKRLVWHGRNTLDVQMPSWRKVLAGEEVFSPLMWCGSPVSIHHCPSPEIKHAWALACVACSFGFRAVVRSRASAVCPVFNSVVSPARCRFQFVTCLVSHYLVYGLIVVVITFITATASASMSRQHYRRLADVARRSNAVEVERDGAVMVVPSSDLVPGDLVLISDDMDLPCDMLLVSGECLVIEAALTGESFPVVKVAIDISGEGVGCGAAGGGTGFAGSDEPSHAKSKLAAGTTVLQTRRLGGAPVKARVWATGFWSDKGRLIRAILFPRSGRLLLLQARRPANRPRTALRPHHSLRLWAQLREGAWSQGDLGVGSDSARHATCSLEIQNIQDRPNTVYGIGALCLAVTGATASIIHSIKARARFRRALPGQLRRRSARARPRSL